MDCREIQKLLSPFIDNELGACDTFTVAEHIDACTACHTTMQEMQQLDERLQTAGRVPQNGIDEFREHILSLFAPWAWVRQWRRVGVAAAALLFLVIGPQLFSAPYDPEARAFSHALVKEMRLNDNSIFSLAWLDTTRLDDVLRQEGLTDLPNLSPAGFHLVRARVSYPLKQVFVQLVYQRRSEEVSIFVSRRWKRALPGMHTQDGYTISPLGIRAVFLVNKDTLPDFTDVHQLAEEEISALSI